jgi:hypothetical protein
MEKGRVALAGDNRELKARRGEIERFMGVS